MTETANSSLPPIGSLSSSSEIQSQYIQLDQILLNLNRRSLIASLHQRFILRHTLCRFRRKSTTAFKELSKGKRQLADMVEISASKSSEMLDFDLNEPFVSETHQADPSSLIAPIGPDNSISCLLRCSRSDYGSIASLNRNFRSWIRSGELYKLRRQLGIVEHWVYFSCDLTEWQAFDPIRLRWIHLPKVNSCECFSFSDKESLAVGTELLVFGKGIMSFVIHKYSILTNSWSLATNMNSPRCLFGSASLGQIGIIAGGCEIDGTIVNSAELYNSDNDTWVPLPSMHKARKMCSGVFMDGKFYVIGGIGGDDSTMLTCAEVYDLGTKKWTEIPNMFPAQEGEGASARSKSPPLLAVVKNELYAAYYAAKEVKKYNKETNNWVTVGKLPDRVWSMQGWGLAFRACGDSLVVVGGPLSSFQGIIEINAWVPDQGLPEWRMLARKDCGSFVYNCAVMGC